VVAKWLAGAAPWLSAEAWASERIPSG